MSHTSPTPSSSLSSCVCVCVGGEKGVHNYGHLCRFCACSYDECLVIIAGTHIISISSTFPCIRIMHVERAHTTYPGAMCFSTYPGGAMCCSTL